jgi:3,4-dihydroxy 2-butanone 4-phosphate synthase/GTP cyclohydrolase II
VATSTNRHGLRDATDRSARFARVRDTLADVAAGKFVVLHGAENNADASSLFIAAELAGYDAVTFMIREAGGFIGLALTPERCDALGLQAAAPTGETYFRQSFMRTIEARDGVTTGAGFHDQLQTVRVAIDPASTADDVAVGGQVRPMKAAHNGVLQRSGHAETAVDLARLAGLNPSGLLCGIEGSDGLTAHGDELTAFADRHGLRVLAVADLVAYRQHEEKLVERVTEVLLPTRWGDFLVVGYRGLLDDTHHIALIKGELTADSAVPAEILPACLQGHVFRSRLCDCRAKLESALGTLEREGRGVIVYLTQETGKDGLLDQLAAHHQLTHPAPGSDELTRTGLVADELDYNAAAQILQELGISSIRLLNSTSDEIDVLELYGLGVTGVTSAA